MSKEALKKDLLTQVKRDLKNTKDPSKEALKLAEQAHETQTKFEKAIKKPKVDMEKRTVQFKLDHEEEG